MISIIHGFLPFLTKYHLREKGKYLQEYKLNKEIGIGLAKQGVRCGMKLGKQEVGVYPLWIGVLLLIVIVSILLGIDG